MTPGFRTGSGKLSPSSVVRGCTSDYGIYNGPTTNNQGQQPVPLAIVAITPGGASLARSIGRALPEAEVFLPERFRRNDGLQYFAEPLGELLPKLFAEGKALACIMATGIVVRVLAPHLQGKEVDPAVVVLDEAGHYAVSLLAGHLGGANDLARKLARLTGGYPVITTATDVNGLPAWDDVAKREGLSVEPLGNIRHLNTLLLQGGRILLVDRQRRVARYFEEVPGVFIAPNFAEAMRSPAEARVFVTHRHIPQLEERDDLLVLRPRDLVVGVGCNRGTPMEEIEATVFDELQRAFLSNKSIACLATISEKADEEGLVGFAGKYGLPLELHKAEALNRLEPPSGTSPHALSAVGARGVCEPAALLSSGAASLLVRKKRRGNVTVAVAEKAGKE
jgi:cobalt-precorrin 5A hydrolase